MTKMRLISMKLWNTLNYYPFKSGIIKTIILMQLCAKFSDSVGATRRKTKTESVTMMRAAQFEAGGPEKLYVGQMPRPGLREKEILIKVYSTAINRADTLQRKGVYPPPAGESSILGLEAVGTVEQLGPSCTDKWKIGDRVMALLPGGGNAEFVAVNENHAMSVPADLSFTEAAAIPEVWLTAYQLLHKIASVSAGDRVLIHAGASGVGTAAVQLVRLAGAVPYITAGSAGKIQLAKSYGAEEGFNYKEGDFTQAVLKASDDKGVNIVLDCVGASMWEQNANVVAMDGRWVLYGLLGGPKVDGDLLARLLRKRISITGTTLRARSAEYKADLVKSFAENALPHFITKTLRPVIDRVLSLDDIAEAHKLMESNKNSGKIILTVREEAQPHSEL